jgi:glutathione S-transferase
MAPQYKLTYFNAKGLAENTRLIFAQAGVEYEDKRIDKEQWATLKESRIMFKKINKFLNSIQ